MSESFGIYVIGQQQVAIFVPSLYRLGGVIPPGDQTAALAFVQDELSRLFGGSTARVGVEEVRGTFSHQDGSGRVSAEPLRRVFAVVKSEDIEKPATRTALEQLAATVATRLDQESVLFSIGPQYACADGERGHPARHVEFKNFDDVVQRRFVRGACDQLHRAADFRGVLSLNGWQVVAKPELDPERRIAFKEERRAILVDRAEALPPLAPGDFVFADDSDGQHILIWAQTDEALVGPRRVPVTGTHVSRVTVDVALSLLESDAVPSLGEVLARDLATGAFYRRYARLHDRLAKAIGKATGRTGTGPREAQRLLGRLMFLRFLERREWLAKDAKFLENLFRQRGSRPYTEVLDELFRELDTRLEDRSPGARRDVPFLNGGLFHSSSSSTPVLDDGFFDPAKPDSVLSLFSEFDFTLDERASADEAVAVNPAMFGRVLESLCDPGRKKRTGVVYTPRPIAFALAFESIASRLATLTRLPRSAVAAFLRGDEHAVSAGDAEQLLKKAKTLRIVDPAVGSGSLLLEALEVLLLVSVCCRRRAGSVLLRGKADWGKETREYVENCLFGVDVDSEAVEVARLRLWLAISVADDEPRPLPDLTWNLCVGDSLASRRFDRVILERGLWKKTGSLFDREAREFEEYASALRTYQRLASRGGSEVAEASNHLEAAERRLLQRLGTQGTLRPRASAPGSAPFAWSVHFGEVFARKNQGFDVVIANPPYVRAANVTGDFGDYESMKGNRDLYLAFVERALDLAGKDGEIAYILPNFGDKKWAGSLRRLLAQRGSVERMLSFGDQQVFRGATNYVALLFATAKQRKASTFQGGRVSDEAWREAKDSTWVDAAAQTAVRATADSWNLRTCDEERALAEMDRASSPLGALCKIGVGVQTSADDVFLFETVRDRQGQAWRVHSAYLNSDIAIEAAALRRCAKGSKDLQGRTLLHDRWMLWPYGEDAKPLEEAALRKDFPLAWEYLSLCQERLEGRAMSGKSIAWWRFGRPQGTQLATSPKLLVPSIMKGAACFLDLKGQVVMTASGKGGGGAWGIVPKLSTKGRALVDLEWLANYLASPQVWTWLHSEGDAKANGWRGVDRSVLSRLPVVIP